MILTLDTERRWTREETLGGRCGPATRRVLQRQFEVFG